MHRKSLTPISLANKSEFKLNSDCECASEESYTTLSGKLLGSTIAKSTKSEYVHLVETTYERKFCESVVTQNLTKLVRKLLRLSLGTCLPEDLVELLGALGSFSWNSVHVTRAKRSTLRSCGTRPFWKSRRDLVGRRASF